MTKDRKSTVRDTSRLFTVTVNEYCNHCMKGVLYQGGVAPGTRYRSFMEMILQMDLIFDRMACPMQTMTVRRFTGTTVTVPKLEPQERFETGKFAAFQIYVRYRYNASWQGDIIWQNGLNSRHFESVLQLIQLIDEILTGKYTVSKKIGTSRACQIAVESLESGLLTGNVQNASVNYIEQYKGTIGMAYAMVQLIEIGIKDDIPDGQVNEDKIITRDALNCYWSGGKKATFLVKVLFREHSTWQGVISWRETGEKRTFRSFKEMLLLLVSATTSVAEGGLQKKIYFTKDKGRALVRG